MKQNKIAISLLAHGDVHIEECMNLIDSIKQKINYNFDFYLATDKPEKYINYKINLIKIEGDFNYNLKWVPINESLKYHNVTIFLDSDTIAKNDMNFDNLINIEDGIYGYITHDHDTKNFFYRTLRDISKKENLTYIFEHIMIVKLSDPIKKKNFIDNWKKLTEDTKRVHRNSKGRFGSSEGLIIALSSEFSNIKLNNCLENPDLNIIFDNFIHLNHEFNDVQEIREKKTNKMI